MRERLLIFILICYVRIVGWTSKSRYMGQELLPPPPFIYAFWHNRLIFMSYLHRGRGIKSLVSTSRDGDVASKVAASMGYRMIRGTASDPRSGTRSFRSMIRNLRKGAVVALTPDGPRGPSRRVKPGTAFIARSSGCPVIPLSCSVKRKKVLKTWDRFQLPLPFNRVIAVSGSPVYIGKKEDIPSACLRIGKAIESVTLKSDALVRDL